MFAVPHLLSVLCVCSLPDAINYKGEPDARTVCCGCLRTHRDGSVCFRASLVSVGFSFVELMCIGSETITFVYIFV